MDAKPFLQGDIYIDGKKRGTVPDQFDLLVGEHEIVVKGVLEGKRLMGTKKVKVKEGANIELTVSMVEESGSIRVSCSPYGARVFVDGTYKGTAPLTIGDIAKGEHTIKIEKEGYKAEEERVSVEGGIEASLRIELKKEFVDTVLETVYVSPGSYSMGSTAGDSDEKPVHTVRITRGFYISKYEVTQKQWKEVMGTNTSRFEGDNRPVENISWYDAVEFCNRLSRREGLTPCYSSGNISNRENGCGYYIVLVGGQRESSIYCDFSANGYRLPTEAEWEYAARGGSKSRSYTYSGSSSAGDVGWYKDNSGGETHEVGRKKPNELGLYDMSGNVREWCWDWYGRRYSSSSQTDPTGPSGGSYRVLRGGSWRNRASRLRVAYRIYYNPSFRFNLLGFRPVRTAE